VSDLFIVDNGDKNWKAKTYLHDWADLAHTFDVATGYFEIGALLALDGQWQKLDKLRILMGDEVSKSTKKALLEGVQTVVTKNLDESIEREKEKNDFLSGVPAIVEAIRNRQIECKVYAKKKFHAKAYITHARQEVLGSMALVGSSNFTLPGLTDNVELKQTNQVEAERVLSGDALFQALVVQRSRAYVKAEPTATWRFSGDLPREAASAGGELLDQEDLRAAVVDGRGCLL
jgi:phosphatidylserine/phosphatidylglycerophosphate/cardiolipin synthase-like enzyme